MDNKIVGIGTTILHNNIAWLAHIIVHPDHRNKGIGQRITQTLIDGSQEKKCDTIYLIATDLGAPIYEKIGFETEAEYLFFKDIKADPDWLIAGSVAPITDSFKERIAMLDHEVSGEERMFQIEPHLKGGYVFQQDNVVEGYYLPTFGEGIILANTPAAGIELMKLRLKVKDNAAFPAGNLDALNFLTLHQYKEFKRAKRMRLGKKREWKQENIYNRIGGNLG